MLLQNTFHRLYDKLHDWIQSLILHLPNVLVALILLLIFWTIGKILRRLTHEVMTRAALSEHVVELAAGAVQVGLVLVGLFIALGTVGLDKTVTSLLAGAGIIGIAVGLAFQATGENFLAGLYMSVSRPFTVGQIIKTNDYFGTVERIAWRAIWLRTLDGQLVLLPNKQVLENPIINYSDTGRRRVDVKVGVAYGTDLENAKLVALRAVDGIDGLIDDMPVQVFYDEFGDSSINFELRFWIQFDRQVEYRAARSDAIIRIKRAFDENGITIPFPIRTLDFSTVGGRTLMEAMKDVKSEDG